MPVDYKQFFQALARISKAIHGGRDTGEILEIIVSRVAGIMAAQGCIFWILDTRARQIHSRVVNGFHFRSLAEVDYKVLAALFPPDRQQVAHIVDARYDERIPDLERLGKRRIRSILGIPLPIAGSYHGILAVYFGRIVRPGPAEIDFLTALGEQGATALQKALRHDESALRTFRETVAGLALALEAKDMHTHGHCLKVAHYAGLTARQLGLSRTDAQVVYHAGLLHDIGKIGMGDRLLFRLGRLSPREMATVQAHPVIGARIVKPLHFLSRLAPLIRHHHERWDGRGYPDRKKGRQIPVGARIIAVCDAFDTMVSGRPSMARIAVSDAVARLRAGAGTRFDPLAVDALASVVAAAPETVSPLEIHQSYFDKYGHHPGPQRSAQKAGAPWFADLPPSF